mgnify:CR=1 FL=1
MRALIQRVSGAGVRIDDVERARIRGGMLILLGVSARDTEESARYLAERCAHLRMFEDDAGKMNLSVLDTHGEALVVSQFTLYGDTRKGNRPGFTDAAAPALAEALYEEIVFRREGSITRDGAVVPVLRDGAWQI